MLYSIYLRQKKVGEIHPLLIFLYLTKLNYEEIMFLAYLCLNKPA